MEAVLRLEGLQKSYRGGWRKPRRWALRGLDLEVPHGSIVGLLGPNGAGKTTTLKIIMGLARPDAGRVFIFGEDGSHVRSRSRMGFLPEQPYYELYLSPRRLLLYYGRLAGMGRKSLSARIGHLLNLVGLEEVADLPMEKFSKGMLQRVGLAQALLSEPELLVLDEPSTGLDPLGKVEVRGILDQLRRSGTTVLLSSHQLSEIEEVCDMVALINEGRNVASGSIEELLRSRDEYEIRVKKPPSLEVSPLPASAAWSPSGDRLFLHRRDLQEALRVLLQGGVEVEQVAPRRMTLEEFFISHVAGERRVG